MNRAIYSLITLSFILAPTLSVAFFCPTNFTQIDYGSTIEAVTAACGKPDKKETTDKDAPVPQEWSYAIPQTVSSNYMAPTQGTLKTQMMFDSSGKAVNISVNGIGVGSTVICGKTIALGDTSDSIKAACGDPSFVNKGVPASGQAKSVKITTFIYNSNPPTKLIFEDGKLKEKE